MSTITYSVENEHGDASGSGMTLERARRAAQHEANRVQATRYVIPSDPDAATETVEPEVTP